MWLYFNCLYFLKCSLYFPKQTEMRPMQESIQYWGGWRFVSVQNMALIDTLGWQLVCQMALNATALLLKRLKKRRRFSSNWESSRVHCSHTHSLLGGGCTKLLDGTLTGPCLEGGRVNQWTWLQISLPITWQLADQSVCCIVRAFFLVNAERLTSTLRCETPSWVMVNRPLVDFHYPLALSSYGNFRLTRRIACVYHCGTVILVVVNRDMVQLFKCQWPVGCMGC